MQGEGFSEQCADNPRGACNPPHKPGAAGPGTLDESDRSTPLFPVSWTTLAQSGFYGRSDLAPMRPSRPQ